MAPPPTPEIEPRFASDEEALAAAEEAYAAYLAASDQVIRDGGAGVERVREFLSDEMYSAEKEAMEELQASGRYGVGHTRFSLTLQSFDGDTLVAYVCDDQLESDLLDSAGNSVVPADGLRRIPFEIEFRVDERFVIVREDLWSGEGVC